MELEECGTEELADAVSKKRPTSLRLLCSPCQLEDFPSKEA